MAEVTEQTQQSQQQDTPQPQPAPLVQRTGGSQQFYGTGRRKRSVARVYLRPGQGDMVVNGRALDQYFPTKSLQNVIQQPLEVAETAGQFNITVTVAGGGQTGQAEAIRLGISRALLEYNVELRQRLKKLGLLTRDARIHERKKYGQKGARKRFQFSKR
jgi:small subunit ribosomal protein S9